MTQALARGIPIVPTPFDVAGRLDDEGITTLVAFEVHHGIPGLNVLGVMGEAHKLAEGPARCPGHGRRFRPPARASTTSPSPSWTPSSSGSVSPTAAESIPVAATCAGRESPRSGTRRSLTPSKRGGDACVFLVVIAAPG